MFDFAIPAGDYVIVFTDHSAIYFLKDGTPCESVLLDDRIIDAAYFGKELFVANNTDIRKF